MGDTTAPTKSVSFELFDLSITLCKIYNMTPFDILSKDVEEVIMLINYHIEKSSDSHESYGKQVKGEERIKVNEKTATGGWF